MSMVVGPTSTGCAGMTISRSVSGSSVHVAGTPSTEQPSIARSIALRVMRSTGSTTSTAIDTVPVNVAAARSGANSTS